MKTLLYFLILFFLASCTTADLDDDKCYVYVQTEADELGEGSFEEVDCD